MSTAARPKVAPLSEHELAVLSSQLETSTSAAERSAVLLKLYEERSPSDAVRVLLAYADRYPRGAVLLAPYFFVEVAERFLTKPEAVADVGLQKVNELVALVQRVMRGG